MEKILSKVSTISFHIEFLHVTLIKINVFEKWAVAQQRLHMANHKGNQKLIKYSPSILCAPNTIEHIPMPNYEEPNSPY